MRRGLTATLVLVVAATTALGARGRLERLHAAREGQSLLYLPNGRQLELLSMGHASLLADWIYVWAIQHYSDYDRQDRYRYVEHVFDGVITELDPHYIDPYWLGAMILLVEAHDLDAGLRLLDKGFAANPEQWVLPYLAGWECHRAGRAAQADAYFERASRVAGAPPHVRRIRAGIAARSGDPRQALALWLEVLDDPASDAATRAIAERQSRALVVRIDVAELESAVERYRQRHGRRPGSLDELVAAGLATRRLDPDGRPYAYDPRTGRVSSVAGHVLGDR